MKIANLIIPAILAALFGTACNSEKKGNLGSSQDGTDTFEYKPPAKLEAPKQQPAIPKKPGAANKKPAQ
jgi:hypothetical protein